jgi:glycosyltransferase involved in cell wall biosynthesis
MARLLVRCLEQAGHRVTVISELRTYLSSSDDVPGWAALQNAASRERDRITHLWAEHGPADIWFCYHPYYKSPDLIGPDLTTQFGIPYVTCEASYSARRNIGIWVDMQARALSAVKHAAVNLCITERDRLGLLDAAPDAKLVRFPPFLENKLFDAKPAPLAGHLVCAAMMRNGDKFESYKRLAATLALLPHDQDWHLSVAGDGPIKQDVHALFAAFQPSRITWLGQLDRPQIASLFATGAVYVWPGCGEAYGLAYLEAQAAGLPVVAQAVAGVPEVVIDGVTGILTATGDDAASAAAIMRLLDDTVLQRRMGQAARSHVVANHSFDWAVQKLNNILQDVVGTRK